MDAVTLNENILQNNYITDVNKALKSCHSCKIQCLSFTYLLLSSIYIDSLMSQILNVDEL